MRGKEEEEEVVTIKKTLHWWTPDMAQLLNAYLSVWIWIERKWRIAVRLKQRRKNQATDRRLMSDN